MSSLSQTTTTATTDFRKRKRKSESGFRFKNFGEHGYPVEFDGSLPFRRNVEALLEYGNLESNLCSSGMQCWSFQLEVHRHPPLHVLFFVVEEPIEASLNIHCNHCQYVGWGHHLICNKKYHFLIPSMETVTACLNCEGGCDVEDIAKGSKLNLVELQGHIMHGVFHSNGFGHLLCINGVEAGSELTGHQIMDFWNRLCAVLKARKVSLNDSSQKRGTELRLLHGVAYGESWFGHWGYKFGRGTYGITQPVYQKAIEAIQGMPLYLLSHHLANINHEIPVIFSRYQTLSDNSLATLGDLFHFMLELKSCVPKDQNSFDSYNQGILVEANCRWSAKRVEMATRVIIEALKSAEFRWVSRQEVRDAARVYIGDTGLLDFVLKSLGNQVVGNYLVRRSLNPVTKVLEYCLEKISDVISNQEGNLVINNSHVKARYKVTKAQLMKDIFYLFKYILKDHKAAMNTGLFSAIPVATRVILDTKYLVKDHCCGEISSKIELGFEGKLKLYCTVILRSHENTGTTTKSPMLPYECINMKSNATFNDLNLEVERNFREIYWGLRSFEVESIANTNGGNKGSDLIFGVVEVGRKIILEGSSKNGGILYENGVNNRIVDCPCGAKDDDGERMVSCDICEVWQHTRCVRIPNNQETPHIFLCNRCEREIVPLSSLP